MAANPAETLSAFAHSLGICLSPAQLAQLNAYAQCVWQKKDLLNLTSVSSQAEIFDRHLADGLVACAQIQKLLANLPAQNPVSIADVGSGAGYIGLTIAVVFPQANITLVESLERRCAFLTWAVLQTGLKNVKIKKARLGQNTRDTYHLVTERAMGALPDILDICLAAVKPAGYFLAFQGAAPQTEYVAKESVLQGIYPYRLPSDEADVAPKRHLVIFEKKP